MKLNVHSLQSLGTLDGPGVRFVVFLQGCNLRCKCCHNPDTWDTKKAKIMSCEEIVERALRYKEYFGTDGGITLSGGEPLMQAKVAFELFSLCKSFGINTCLDTSGSVLTDDVKKLLSVTDRVLLDIKFTNEADYLENAGCSLSSVLEFLTVLDLMRVPTTLRQVIIPTVNDGEENIDALKKIRDLCSCVDGVELLAFRKLCMTKYEEMSIEFPFAHLPETTKDKIDELTALL